MRNFCIKTTAGAADYLAVMSENEDGLMVRIFRDMDGYEKIIEEFMSRSLFESCLRTGYIVEMEDKSAFVVA